MRRFCIGFVRSKGKLDICNRTPHRRVKIVVVFLNFSVSTLWYQSGSHNPLVDGFLGCSSHNQHLTVACHNLAVGKRWFWGERIASAPPEVGMDYVCSHANPVYYEITFLALPPPFFPFLGTFLVIIYENTEQTFPTEFC